MKVPLTEKRQKRKNKQTEEIVLDVCVLCFSVPSICISGNTIFSKYKHFIASVTCQFGFASNDKHSFRSQNSLTLFWLHTVAAVHLSVSCLLSTFSVGYISIILHVYAILTSKYRFHQSTRTEIMRITFSYHKVKTYCLTG